MKILIPPLNLLYTIFEDHLYQFQDPHLNRKKFIEAVVLDYLSFLKNKKITVPIEYEELVLEELYEQVKSMLLKKIYGCLENDQYHGFFSSLKKKVKKNKF